MASRHLNMEKIFKGRSHAKGEHASDPRESGATKKAKTTIRAHKARSAEEADRRTKNQPDE